MEAVNASTVMLLGDDHLSRMRVLMLRRNLKLEFVGGAFVFPGGKVDPGDGGPSMYELCEGLDDAQASRMLNVEKDGLAFWVAGIRECFEEAGLLIGRADGTGVLPATGSLLIDTSDPSVNATVLKGRAELNSRSKTFREVLEELGVRLACDLLHYFAHWITPEGSPRRYDTRFLIGRVPQFQTATEDQGETVEAAWIAPSEALSRHREGLFEMILPTIKNLEAISGFGSATEAISQVSRLHGVQSVLPKLVRDSQGVRVLLPWDEGYGDAVGAILEAEERLPISPKEA